MREKTKGMIGRTCNMGKKGPVVHGAKLGLVSSGTVRITLQAPEQKHDRVAETDRASSRVYDVIEARVLSIDGV